MHRFYLEDTALSVGQTVPLSEEDAHHARRVLRMAPGDECRLLGDGRVFSAEIAEVTDAAVTCRVCNALPSPEAALRVTLYQGLPKADKMELIVQKLTELGAVRVVPVAMSRCVVQLNGKDGAKKQERWQKIAREAAKQSGRAAVTQVDAPISFKAMLCELAACENVLIPWEDAAGFGPRAFHAAHPDVQEVALVIGPEGGMSAQEVAQMKDAGAVPVTLGPRILRTETAGLAACAALLALYGDMG